MSCFLWHSRTISRFPLYAECKANALQSQVDQHIVASDML